MSMTHLMFEINLLGCEAAYLSVVGCFEWRNSKFGVYKCIFFLICKRESQQIGVQEHSISVQNWWFPWISLDDSFLTQVLESSDHLKKSNTGKAQLFYTGKESTWHGYIEFRDLHHPPMFLDRSGGAGREITASSRGAAYSKKPQSKALTPCWLLLFSLAMCCPEQLSAALSAPGSAHTKAQRHRGYDLMLMVLPFIVWLPWDFPCFV